MVKGRKKRTILDGASRCMAAAFFCWVIYLAAVVAIGAVALSACLPWSSFFFEGLSVYAWIAVVPCLILHWHFLREARARLVRAAKLLHYPDPELARGNPWKKRATLVGILLLLTVVVPPILVMGVPAFQRNTSLDYVRFLALVLGLLVLIPAASLADHYKLLKRVAALRDHPPDLSPVAK